MKKVNWGLTNNTYCNQRFVLRVSKSRELDVLLLNRNEEIKILNILSDIKADWMIPLINYGYNQIGNFYLTTKYIPDLKQFDVKNQDLLIITKLQQVVSAFHNIKIPQGINLNQFNFISFLNKQKQAINQKIFSITSELKIKESLIIKSISKLKIPQLVLSHQDLHAGNILCGEKQTIKLIDFEYACLNTPLFDIASFISENKLTNKQIKKWLLTWNLTQAEMKTLKIIINYQNIVWIYWSYAMMSLQTDHHDIFQKIIAEKYANLFDPVVV